MHVLLTGSSGWLGRYLAPRLLAAGHRVTGLDVAPGAFTDVIGSVADRALVDRLFGERSIEAVIHAAALHKPDIVRYPAQAFIDVNVTGTLNLLQAATSAGHDRFVFTSTTSLMISDAIRRAEGDQAVWIDETMTPLEPRNIYGVTKLAAEHLCRLFHGQRGIATMILRTGRFFPEDDDTHAFPSGDNMKANELLNRRLTVEDAADAHIVALDRAPDIGFGTFILSAPTPFQRSDVAALKQDAAAVVARYFPDAAALYAARGWVMPQSIDRVYDAGLAERQLGFRAATDFAVMLESLRAGLPSPIVHDAGYTSPKERLHPLV